MSERVTVAELQQRLWKIANTVDPKEWLPNPNMGGCLMMRALDTWSTSLNDYTDLIISERGRRFELEMALYDLMDASDNQDRKAALSLIRGLDAFIPDKVPSDLTLREVVESGSQAKLARKREKHVKV